MCGKRFPAVRYSRGRYQDTNRLQAEIVRALAAVHRNVMVWGTTARPSTLRGAHYRNILISPSSSRAKIYKLEETTGHPADSRCGQRDHPVGSGKYTSAPKPADTALAAHCESVDEGTQSDFVCDRVRALQRQGSPFGTWRCLPGELPFFRSGVALTGPASLRQVRGFRFVEAATSRMYWLTCVLRNPQDGSAGTAAPSRQQGGRQTEQEIISYLLEGEAGPERWESTPETPGSTWATPPGALFEELSQPG